MVRAAIFITIHTDQNTQNKRGLGEIWLLDATCVILGAAKTGRTILAYNDLLREQQN